MQLFLFKLNRIFWYGFISLLITILFSLFEYDITEPSFIIWAFGFGLVLGVFEEFIIGNWFRKLSKFAIDEHKIIGYCYDESNWEKALEINNNVEIVSEI